MGGSASFPINHRVWQVGFRVLGGIRASGLAFRIEGLGFTVKGRGGGVGLGFRV